MSYCQLNADGSFRREVFAGLQEWDENNYCQVDALVNDGKAAQFRIVPLLPTPAPGFNPATHIARRDGVEKAGQQWQYKWRVDALTAPELSAIAAATAAAIKAAQDNTDAAATKADAKVLAIGAMTPAQVRAWVAANVLTLVDAKDLIATLAVVVSMLARRL